jgi:formylglycine-generating enzyme required for sulfatase activity
MLTGKLELMNARMFRRAEAVALALGVGGATLAFVASSGACGSFGAAPESLADGGTLSMDGALDGGRAEGSVEEAGCVRVNGSAGAGPSCSALAPTCGPDERGDCCAWNEVEGGTFYRSDNPDFPATVCSFRLDTYEITVGRFRKFVEAYAQDAIGAGAGKNVNNPDDPGWNVGWNATNLPTAKAPLIAAVKCSADYQTWTDAVGPNENKPMNCITWFEAEAFCIWDGGRLPTEAEWFDAAAGGSAQRRYPWGDAGPGPNADLAVYGCWFNGTGGQCTGVTNIAHVGSAKNGNGTWGHADLAGNVWEWTQDWDRFPYDIVPCSNCADTKAGAVNRVTLGGAFSNPSSYVLASSRFGIIPGGRGEFLGARCARTP